MYLSGVVSGGGGKVGKDDGGGLVGIKDDGGGPRGSGGLVGFKNDGGGPGGSGGFSISAFAFNLRSGPDPPFKSSKI